MSTDDANPRSLLHPLVRHSLSRKAGWRMPANTVKVSRPGKWGNPFLVGPDRTQGEAVGAFRIWLTATKRFMAALDAKLADVNAGFSRINPAASPEFNTRNSGIKTVRGRGDVDAGTWAHPYLAIECARWLSPEFAVACNEFLYRIWTGRIVSEPPGLADLPAGRREHILLLLEAMQEIHASATRTQTAKALQARHRNRRGFNYRSLFRHFRNWSRSGQDWRSLDRYHMLYRYQTCYPLRRGAPSIEG